MINSMLRDVVKSGTATRANALGRSDLAGKTGTTNDGKDVWFNGYTATIAATTWIGFDNPASLGSKETGGDAALPMWMSFMHEALKGVPQQALVVPEGLPKGTTASTKRKTRRKTDTPKESQEQIEAREKQSIWEFFDGQVAKPGDKNTQTTPAKTPVRSKPGL
jgi:penicillin-binding protein 1A